MTITIEGKYKVCNGTCYNVRTEDAVIRVIEEARQARERLRFHYASIIKPGEDGHDWLEESEMEGYIGRSCGTIKIPLCLRNSRTMGGSGILTHCIGRITRAGRVRVELYRHPLYRVPVLILGGPGPICHDPAYVAGVYRAGDNVANFRTTRAAKLYISRMEDRT